MIFSYTVSKLVHFFETQCMFTARADALSTHVRRKVETEWQHQVTPSLKVCDHLVDCATDVSRSTFQTFAVTLQTNNICLENRYYLIV